MTEDSLGEYDAKFRLLEAKLRPIAERTDDIREPDFLERLRRRPHPLDEAGVRAEAENLLAAIAELYATAPAARGRIRDLFGQYKSVSWAVWPPLKPTSDKLFRLWLLAISMKDKEEDPRDTLTRLRRVCREASDANVNIRPILESIAAISSDEDAYGFGSMRKMLLDAQHDHGPGAS
jgi:hypothetical protein